MITKRTVAEGEWTASELRKLPPDWRDAVLAAVAERAEREYRTNTQLTDFEAFAEDDLHATNTAAAEG